MAGAAHWAGGRQGAVIVRHPAKDPAAAPQIDLFGRAPQDAAAGAPARWSVSELTARIKGALEAEFQDVEVAGELSNCRRHTSGHLYFTLKDGGARLDAVMWRQTAARLRFEPKDGLQAVCRGRVEVYPPHGKYQLIVDRLDPLGAGALALAFEQLKDRLAGEGLFDPARKRPLPFLPRRIGVVTSPTGAALRDFLRVLHVRFPALPVLVAPARVQGDGAAAEIVTAIDRLSAGGEVDVIVVTRGGGSMEDLWAFNEEEVARAIARSRVPVVSAIGHEIDFTIADFVADRRAPTPTGAAEILAPVRLDLEAGARSLAGRLGRAFTGGIQGRRQDLLRLRMRLADPRRGLADRKLFLADAQERLAVAARAILAFREQALRKARLRVEAQDPRVALAVRLRELHARRAALERGGRQALGLPERRVALSVWSGRLNAAAGASLASRRAALGVEAARLSAISPQRVFERGYSLTRLVRDRSLVRAAAAVRPGDEIEIVLGLREEERGWSEERLRAVVRSPPESEG